MPPIPSNMHTAAKVMLAVGVVLCAIGAGIWIMGADSVEFDIENDAAYDGTSGTWDYPDDDYFSVYVKDGTSCSGFSASMTDENGSSVDYWGSDNIEIRPCESWNSTGDGFMDIGYINADGPGEYTMESSSKIYVVGVGEEIGEAVGGIFAIMGSWMVLCCGASFLFLGAIFALTLKEGGSQMVVVQQQMPGMVVPTVTHMSAPQYEQPVQYQAPVQEMQPPQGGL